MTGQDTAAEPAPEGAWKHLHPATPLLKGGIAFVAVLGFIVAGFRERLVETAVGSPDIDNVVVDIYERGELGLALVAVCAVLLIGVVGFALSWLMHLYRINSEAVEVRSGILFRTNRKARLDRIQDIVITRPIVARLFGAARLELSVAGQDSTVQLAYLRGSDVERLRAEILMLAGGRMPIGPVRGNDPADDPAQAGAAAEIDSVVRIPMARLIGSILLQWITLGLFAVLGVLFAGTVMDQELAFALLLVPGMLAGIGYIYSQVLRSLKFSIAGGSDGVVRIGYGLFTISNDSLPPGRIHAIEVYQSVLWRPLGWWAVRINRAGHASHRGRSRQSAIVLPVGRLADVERVLALLMPGSPTLTIPGAIRAGLIGSAGQSSGYVRAPRRSAVLRPLSWQRTAFAVTPDAVLIRRGILTRSLVVIPLQRLQGIDFRQGPLRRALGLARLRLHTVPGPVSAVIAIPAAEDARDAFAAVTGAIALESRPESRPEEIGAVQ